MNPRKAKDRYSLSVNDTVVVSLAFPVPFQTIWEGQPWRTGEPEVTRV